MGKIIQCTGSVANQPYVFSLTETNVYTIEEMSYYLYNNIYKIYESILNPNLIHWIRYELGMEELAGKMDHLYHNKNNLKDIVVTILCSNDYYTEKEIKELIEVIDQIMLLPYIKRQKIKADNYLTYGKYLAAADVYESMLASKDIKQFTEEEYGNILHNLAIAKLQATTYEEAASRFKEAFNLNQNEQSLNGYLSALLICNQEEQAKKECIAYDRDVSYLDELTKLIEKTKEDAKKTKEYQKIEELDKKRYQGKVTEFYQETDTMIKDWKKDYRHCVEA